MYYAFMTHVNRKQYTFPVGNLQNILLLVVVVVMPKKMNRGKTWAHTNITTTCPFNDTAIFSAEKR